MITSNSSNNNYIQLDSISKKIQFALFLGYGIMIIQNIAVFTVTNSFQFPLTLDLIGIFILALVSVYLGQQQHINKIRNGGLLLFVWIIISIIWRSAIGIFSNKIELGIKVGNTSSGNSNNNTSIAIFLLIIGSFFLGYGIYLISYHLQPFYNRLRIIVLSYVIVNSVGAILFLVIIGIFIKILLVPVLGIIMYCLFIIETRKIPISS